MAQQTASSIVETEAEYYSDKKLKLCLTSLNVICLFAVLAIFEKLSTVDGVTKYRGVPIS